MRYFILQSHETKGPYTLGQLRSLWHSGAVNGETLYHEEDSENWQTLTTILEELEQKEPTPPVRPPPPETPRPPKLAPAKADEELIFHDQSIRITTAVVVVGGATYALRNINSVRAVGKEVGCLSWIMAGIALLFGLGFVASLNPAGVFFGLLIIGIVVFGIYNESRRCFLIFDTSSGARTGLESKNRAYIQGIADKIAEAMRKTQ